MARSCDIYENKQQIFMFSSILLISFGGIIPENKLQMQST